MDLTAHMIITDDGQSLPFARDLREALALYARRRWPLNTSGYAAKEWGVSKATAANVLKLHASDSTVTTILRAGGWKMAAAVIGAVIGQSLEQHLDQELEAIRAEQSRLDELERAAQARWNLLAASHPDIARHHRPEARTFGRGSGEVGDGPAVATAPTRGRG